MFFDALSCEGGFQQYLPAFIPSIWPTKKDNTLVSLKKKKKKRVFFCLFL